MILDKKLIDSISAKFKDNNNSIAIAESVTGGLLQAAFSNANNASLFFQGGITAYNIGQKCRHLLIEPLHAIECNCVSQKIAVEMSKNVCQLFLSDYGIGITGYAARMPEKNVHDLFAYYAITLKDKILEQGKIVAGVEEGLEAQLFYVNEVLQKLNGLLSSSD
jgi:nicotinamide-nucleotide amidase